MIQAIVFDLDDTLYPEKEFVESGYQAVARHIAGNSDYSFKDLFSSMRISFHSFGRQTVFPNLLMHYPKLRLSLDDCVHIYRHHNPSIRLFPGYGDLLRKLSETYRLGLITDGLPEVQKKKVNALGLAGIIKNIIYSWEYGAERQKPHPYSFQTMLALLQSAAGNTLFVGDNHEKDGQGAMNVGMQYVQIKQFQERSFDSNNRMQGTPVRILGSLFELSQVLQQ
jgi:putative hydrolase of the HAD superfamily